MVPLTLFQMLSTGCELTRVAYHIIDRAYELTLAVPDRGTCRLQCLPSPDVDRMLLKSNPGITYLL